MLSNLEVLNNNVHKIPTAESCPCSKIVLTWGQHLQSQNISSNFYKSSVKTKGITLIGGGITCENKPQKMISLPANDSFDHAH